MKEKSNVKIIMFKFFLSILISAVFIFAVMFEYEKLSSNQRLFSNQKVESSQESKYSTVYSETDLSKSFFEDDKILKSVLISDRVNIQSEFNTQLYEFTNTNEAGVTIDGPSLELKVDNKLIDVGYILKTAIVTGKNTNKTLDFDISKIIKYINVDSNVIWVINSEGIISGYMLMPDATNSNPIAVNIEGSTTAE